ncbi:MAG: protein kinase [Verrucomicrobiales bacterium]|nr:protein kinase [Verrucomicrobiales bacterium]
MNAAPAALPCPQCGTDVPADAPAGLCPRCLVGLNLGGPPHDLAGDPTQDASSPETGVGPGWGSMAEVSALFPQLEIVGCLGRGGMGVVYKARQSRLNRWVALKVLAPGRERDPRFAERFAREAQALARLAHPAIVGVHDFGEVQGHFYLLMEYVDGVNLRTLVRERRFAPERALAVIPRICEALQYAHDQGVVHRDIKPENILIDSQGRVKIADFGIAKLLGPLAPDGALTDVRGVVGTPHYMAPEQVERPTTVDHRADIYSLGVVFYELLTGELPLGKFPPPSTKASIDPRLDAVVLRSLEKEPARRYQRAGEVRTDVETIGSTPRVSEGGSETRTRTDETRARRGLWVLATTVIVLLLLTAMLGFPAWRERSFRRRVPAAQEVRVLDSQARDVVGAASAGDSHLPGSLAEQVPPVVVSTLPIAGAVGVDPELTAIRVTFSKPMTDGRWTWGEWGHGHLPERVAEPRFLADGRTCELPVRLESGRTYAVWINTGEAQDFCDTDGRPAVPYLLVFQTRGTRSQ